MPPLLELLLLELPALVVLVAVVDPPLEDPETVLDADEEPLD